VGDVVGVFPLSMSGVLIVVTARNMIGGTRNLISTTITMIAVSLGEKRRWSTLV
jgi:hypothetical protein